MRASILIVALSFTFLIQGSQGSADIQPVPLQDITLRYNSRYDKAVSLNREYILGIETDRLLKNFRYASNWTEAVETSAAIGDRKVLAKADEIIQGLRKVQDALGGGYLSAFPTEHFERLRNLQAVWAPFYVIHKIMAGLLDHYNFLGNKLALEMVVDEAKFFQKYLRDIEKNEGQDHWYQMLETEYGGMEEVLFKLYEVTGEEQWQRMATNFTKPNFFDPLTQNVDDLPGRHANTHLAQVNGFAAGYSATGDRARQTATSNFFDIITGTHSYATGGNNDGEYWQNPFELAASIAGEGAGRNTEETCTTYNMMKIARYLFQWTGNARYADYYERAILNGMLGVQRMPANYTSKSRPNPSVEVQATTRRLLNSQVEEDGLQAEHFPNNWAANASYRAVSPASPAMLPHSSDWRQQAFAMTARNNKLPESGNEPGPGVIIYLMPLGAGNTKGDSWHQWSTPLDSFWCCSGSIVESFGKLMDSIYFQRVFKNALPELFINQLTPSTLAWRAGGLGLSLETEPFNPENVLRSTITIEQSESPHNSAKEVVVKLRVPTWAEPERSSVKLYHGDELLQTSEEIQPGNFIAIRRKFRPGDKLNAEFGMHIKTEKIVDWHPEFQNLRAVILGNYLMAAITEHDRDIKADPDRIADHLHEVSDVGLRSFVTSNGELLCHFPTKVSLVTDMGKQTPAGCTFRILQLSRHDGERSSWEPTDAPESYAATRLESMLYPGSFLTVTKEGALNMSQQQTSAQTWRFWETSASAVTLSAEAGGVFNRIAKSPSGELYMAEDESMPSINFEVKGAVGKYPEGAKVLQGSDKSYVLAPIGHLIEEKYSPYLQFNTA